MLLVLPTLEEAMQMSLAAPEDFEVRPTQGPRHVDIRICNNDLKERDDDTCHTRYINSEFYCRCESHSSPMMTTPARVTSRTTRHCRPHSRPHVWIPGSPCRSGDVRAWPQSSWRSQSSGRRPSVLAATTFFVSIGCDGESFFCLDCVTSPNHCDSSLHVLFKDHDMLELRLSGSQPRLGLRGESISNSFMGSLG